MFSNWIEVKLVCELIISRILGLGEKKESEVTQSCPTLCNPMDCSPPGSSVHGILQARILEWVAISFSRGSSQPRDWTLVAWIAGRYFTVWVKRKKWQPTLVFLPGESCGRRSLVGCCHRVSQSWTPLMRLSMHACIGEGNGNPLQCSCLENTRGGGAWWGREDSETTEAT